MFCFVFVLFFSAQVHYLEAALEFQLGEIVSPKLIDKITRNGAKINKMKQAGGMTSLENVLRFVERYKDNLIQIEFLQLLKSRVSQLFVIMDRLLEKFEHGISCVIIVSQSCFLIHLNVDKTCILVDSFRTKGYLRSHCLIFDNCTKCENYLKSNRFKGVNGMAYNSQVQITDVFEASILCLKENAKCKSGLTNIATDVVESKLNSDPVDDVDENINTKFQMKEKKEEKEEDDQVDSRFLCSLCDKKKPSQLKMSLINCKCQTMCRDCMTQHILTYIVNMQVLEIKCPICNIADITTKDMSHIDNVNNNNQLVQRYESLVQKHFSDRSDDLIHPGDDSHMNYKNKNGKMVNVNQEKENKQNEVDNDDDEELPPEYKNNPARYMQCPHCSIWNENNTWSMIFCLFFGFFCFFLFWLCCFFVVDILEHTILIVCV